MKTSRFLSLIVGVIVTCGAVQADAADRFFQTHVTLIAGGLSAFFEPPGPPVPNCYSFLSQTGPRACRRPWRICGAPEPPCATMAGATAWAEAVPIAETVAVPTAWTVAVPTAETVAVPTAGTKAVLTAETKAMLTSGTGPAPIAVTVAQLIAGKLAVLIAEAMALISGRSGRNCAPQRGRSRVTAPLPGGQCRWTYAWTSAPAPSRPEPAALCPPVRLARLPARWILPSQRAAPARRRPPIAPCCHDRSSLPAGGRHSRTLQR